jgi:HEXXH motif-containing protein
MREQPPFVPLQPVPVAADRFATGFLQRREHALELLVDSIAGRLGGPEATLVASAGRLFQRLPTLARQRVLLDPLFHHWWLRISQGYRAGDRKALAAWAPALGRFLVVPALLHELWPEDGFLLPTGGKQELRFPGHARYLRLRAPAPTVQLDRRNGAMRVTGHGFDQLVPLHDLLELRDPPRNPLLQDRQVLEGTGIEIDGGDPWVADFMAELDTTSPPSDAEPLRPAKVSPEQARRVAAAHAFLRRCWPAMATEVEDYVRLVVLFAGGGRDAFSNTAWQGAIFLSTDLARQAFNLERLVHETSHLRLNLVMSEIRLHEHAWSDTVPSPFRAGPRPVAGLYHGAVVFTRVAMALDRAFRLSGEPAYQARLPRILRQVDQALETIDQRVTLTPAGRTLLDQVAAETDALRHDYGVLADTTIGPDRYLEE